jgi:hypothetical protein
MTAAAGFFGRPIPKALIASDALTATTCTLSEQKPMNHTQRQIAAVDLPVALRVGGTYFCLLGCLRAEFGDIACKHKQSLRTGPGITSKDRLLVNVPAVMAPGR